MSKTRIVLIIFLCITFVLMGCQAISDEGHPDKAIITDITGREWDITHARDNYGMNPNYYNYGIGVGAIRSIDSPRVIAEGELGYPSSDSEILVFGVNHNDEQRAYSVTELSNHEVFNDLYPGESEQYLAVTY